MDTSFNVCITYWATSPRAIPSNIPSFLLVSLMVAVCVPRICVTYGTLIVEIIIQKQ